MEHQPISDYLPPMTPKRFASLVRLAATPTTPGSMLAYLKRKATVELLAHRMGGGTLVTSHSMNVVPRHLRASR